MGEHGEGGGLEHSTWLHFLYSYHILPEWMPEMVPVTWLVILILCTLVIAASRKLQVRSPSRVQGMLEFLVISLDNFVRGIVGSEARTLTPIIGTLFIFILTLNVFGLIPGLVSPTANINTTVALALFAFGLVQFYGITRLGPVNYVKHFLGEPIWLAPLMLPIHVIGELAKPLSLSIRLFGNIFGEDTVIAILILITIKVLLQASGFMYLPLQFPMMLFGIFTALVQALVFSMLTAIYIAVAVAGHEEHL